MDVLFAHAALDPALIWMSPLLSWLFFEMVRGVCFFWLRGVSNEFSFQDMCAYV
jgi:hypothetical protein